jgi:hypothetical protein
MQVNDLVSRNDTGTDVLRAMPVIISDGFLACFWGIFRESWHKHKIDIEQKLSGLAERPTHCQFGYFDVRRKAMCWTGEIYQIFSLIVVVFLLFCICTYFQVDTRPGGFESAQCTALVLSMSMRLIYKFETS